MNKRRLLKLADLLEADAANKRGVKFDLGTVIDPGNLKAGAKAVPMSCGTSACAMGLAALSGTFKRAGWLSYQIKDLGNELFIETTMNGEVTNYDDAAEALFDLTGVEAGFLFSPGYYPDDAVITGARGERYVAKRIRDFVAGKVAP